MQRPQKAGLCLAISLCSLIALAGCGGSSGGGSAPDSQGARNDVAQGRADLNALIASDYNPTLSQMESIASRFQSAYNKDNSNPEAAFGLAVASTAVQAQKVADTVMGTRGISRAEAARDPAVQVAQMANPLRATAPSADTSARTVGLATKMPFLLAGRKRSVDLNRVRTELATLRSVATNAILLLERVSGRTDFNFVITDPQNPQQTLTIAQGDVRTMLGALYAARALMSIALAYDFNFGSFDFNQTIEARFGSQPVGAIITPNDYLPAAPFGTRTAEGVELFRIAKADLLTAADRFTAALDSLESRASSETRYLLDDLNLSEAEYDTAREGVAEFKTALNQRYTFPDGTTTEIFRWFDNAPASLRAFMPSYRVVEEQVMDWQQGQITVKKLVAAPTDFPDKTFGGLIVNPDDDDFQGAAYFYEPISVLPVASGDDFYGNGYSL